MYLRSLPSRERGLKLLLLLLQFMPERSLPSRERGLKFNNLPNCILCEVVAPLAGAWIEISVNIKVHEGDAVAPLAGAWIEITK